MTNEKSTMSIHDFLPPEEKCFENLRQTRWPNGRKCPKCGSTKTKKNGTENGKQIYWCHAHKGTFRDTTGTIFENSKLPLAYWYYFIFYYQQNQSAKRLSETLGISYSTALGLVRKVHKAVDGQCNEIQLGDIIEFDELYLSCGEKGNCDLDRPPRKRGLKLRGRGTMDKDKPPIIGACDRNGNLRLKVSDHADHLSIFLFFWSIIVIFPNIIKVLTKHFKVFTDDFSSYQFLRKIGIYHESVNHSAGEYARGEVHNNTMEGYWSVFRHWMNTYRGVSKNYLPEYVSFFEFVENYKKDGWFQSFQKIIFFIPLKFSEKIDIIFIKFSLQLNFRCSTL